MNLSNFGWVICGTPGSTEKFEISSTGGMPETFSSNSYTVTATGAPST
jgi:hypothetical protein